MWIGFCRKLCCTSHVCLHYFSSFIHAELVCHISTLPPRLFWQTRYPLSTQHFLNNEFTLKLRTSLLHIAHLFPGHITSLTTSSLWSSELLCCTSHIYSLAFAWLFCSSSFQGISFQHLRFLSTPQGFQKNRLISDILWYWYQKYSHCISSSKNLKLNRDSKVDNL
jgi:hypothetical protein